MILQFRLCDVHPPKDLSQCYYEYDLYVAPQEVPQEYVLYRHAQALLGFQG